MKEQQRTKNEELISKSKERINNQKMTKSKE